jgi:hypothetical protein
MPQHGRRNADQVLATALACGATIEAAARNVNLSKATVYRRMQDVPKKELVSTLQVLLQTRRLQVAPSLPEAKRSPCGFRRHLCNPMQSVRRSSIRPVTEPHPRANRSC